LALQLHHLVAMSQQACTRRVIALGLLLSFSGCGEPEGEDGAAQGQIGSALVSTFSNTSALCPATTSWGAWSQTSLSTWDSDVKPVVAWIISRTGISSSTYTGHSPSIGRAADWRPHSREEGTQLANWFLANTKTGGTPLGIDYIIWQAQIYLISSGVTQMADRGSFTQNHCDHVHVSFADSISFDSAKTTAWGTSSSSDAGPSKDAKHKPPSSDAHRSEHSAGNDSGASSQPTTSEDLGSDDLPPTSYLSSPPSTLMGGCSFMPQGRGDPTDPPWLLLLLLGAICTLARRSSKSA
jgi:hypothetical protein